MTGVSAQGVPGALRRREAFVGERLIGAGARVSREISARVDRMAQFRELKAGLVTRQEPSEGEDGVRLVPVAGGPNWTPIGPIAVLRGQASTKPVVSGRVKGIAISTDGQRVYLATAEGGVWRSGDAGLHWEPMSDILDLLEVPPVALPAGTSPASSLATGAIALVDGGDAEHDRLYVGTGEATTASPAAPDLFGVGMLRSDDGGRTWAPEASSASLLGRGVFAIAVDPGDREHAVAATNNGVFRRTAATAGTATVWAREAIPGVGAGALVTSVTAGRVGGAVRFFAAVDTGPVAMRGPTGAWTALPPVPALPLPPGSPGGASPPAPGRITLAASAGAASVLYALVAQPLGGTLAPGYLHGLFRMDPSSATPTWAVVSGVPASLFGEVTPGGQGQGWYDHGLAVDPTDATRVYVGGSGLDVEGEFSAAVYRLAITAAGTGFTAAPTLIGGSAHADVHALVHAPGSASTLWIGCDGGAYVTDNALGTGNRLFTPRNEGLGTLTLTGMAHLPGEDSYAFCGAQDNGGLRYLGSEVWDHQLYGDGGATVIDWAGRQRLLSIYHDDAVRRSQIAGARYDTERLGPGLPGGTTLFYPPMANPPPSGNPTDAALVALGADVPRLSSGFGDGPWLALPARTPAAAGAKVRALAFASASLLWAGWTDGHLARYDLVGGSWVISDLAAIGVTRPITSIAIDPATPGGEAVYVTLGGASGAPTRVWHMSAPLGGGTAPLAAGSGTWTAAGAGLLDVQHSAIVVDQADPTGNRRWVGADVGVWAWDAGAGTWQVLSAGLPDAAVLELALLPTQNLLRAATYGRGVWELSLAAGAQPAVQLALRASAVDRGRPARTGIPLPSDPNVGNVIDDSPDIAVDAPGSDGRYVLDPAAPITLAGLTALGDRRDVLVSVPEAQATTRVYVTVRTRGTGPGSPAADGVRVALLIGPAGDDETTPPGQLPAGYEAAARDGTVVDADGWKTVGIVSVDGLRAGTPRVAAFDLRSDVLPPVDDSVGKRFALLALVHHADDPFPAGASRDPVALVTAEPRAALRRVAAVAAPGGATTPAGGQQAGAPGGSGLLLPLTTTLLARQRLSDLVDQLTRKATSSTVRPGWGGFSVPVTQRPVEQRVLAMASAALDALSGDPAAGVPRTSPGDGVSRYALLGALGYELPGFTSVLAPGGGWISDTVRRGTPDLQRSRVAVPAAELPLAVARAGLVDAAANASAQRAVRGFSIGMLAAAAAGVAVGPQMADLLAADTSRDWQRFSPSVGAAAVERHLRLRFLGGEARGMPAAWLPAASAVPPAVWSGYVTGLEQVYGLRARRPKGFGAFEAGFDAGDDLTAVRLRNAYGLVLDDLRTSSWSAWAWFGLLAPVVLAPSAAMLIGRELPHAREFFGGNVTERSVAELLTVSMGLGAIAPFVYSMILWGAVDEHTEVFATSLGMGLARAGLVLAQLLAPEDQSEGARWLLMALLAAPDVYAAIRAAVAGSRRPGVSTVFAMQTLPALTGLATLSVSGLLHGLGIDEDWPFWLSWALFTGGMLGVGALAARALASGGGWRSWFMRSDRRFPLLSSVAAAGLLPAEPVAAARVFDDSTLWPDGDAAAALVPAAPSDLAGQDYPTGMRGLVRVWWEGAGTLEIRHADDLVTLRAGGGDGAVRLPAGTTAASLAQLLVAAVAGVRAEVVDTAGPDPALPWPSSVADPGDDGPLADAAVARARFVPVGTTRKAGVVLRHAPRADLSTRIGLLPGSAEAFPVVPLSSLGDLEGSGLGAAADLAVLLAVAAAPSLGPVPVAGLVPPAVSEVVQVFRRWNLDERRLAEWQGLVTGVAPAEGPSPGAVDPLVRTPPGGYAGAQPVGADLVAAMGWIPLWRAWVRMAANLQADAEARVALPSTPLVRFADGAVRRPTNAELTEGVRFLLDLPAT